MSLLIDTWLSLDISALASNTIDLAIRTGSTQDGTNNGSLGNIVARIIQMLGTVAGLGFFVAAAAAGFSRGSSISKGKEAGIAFTIGAVIAAAFNILPNILGFTDTIFFGIF